MTIGRTVSTKRPCPCCGSEHRLEQGRVASEPPAESVEVPALADRWSGFFQDQHVFFTYERCAGCGLLYCPEYLGNDQLAGLYGTMDDNTNGIPAGLLRRTQGSYFRHLARFSPLRGTYLEMGPDIGMFTQRALEDGHFSHYLLCEPNLEVHHHLRNLVGEQGRISARLSDTELLGPGDKVDVVVMIHVLDHLIDPQSLLGELRRRCSDEATLVFVTHDESSLLARLLGSRWPAYCLQHPLLYRRSTVADLLGRCGFEVVASVKSTNWFPVGYLARHLMFALGAPDLHLPSGGPGVPVRLGNIITVARPVPARR